MLEKPSASRAGGRQIFFTNVFFEKWKAMPYSGLRPFLIIAESKGFYFGGNQSAIQSHGP